MAEERITTLPTATAISTTEAEWYVIHGGEELGPLSLAALVEKAVAGDIEADDLVKQTGGLWTKASDLRFIQDARTDGDRQRRQLFPVKDSMQDAREGAGEKASQVAKGMVRPAAWVIFAIGGVLFVLGGPGILRALVWFVLFGAPACLCFRYKKGRGITNVAVVFLLAAGFDAGFAVYNSYILQPRTDAMLRGLNPEAVGGDSLGEWSKQLKAAPQQPAADAPSKDALFYLNRAKTWMQKKEYDKAIEDFSESIRLDPRNAESHMFRGMAWSCKKDYDKAITDYDQVIRLEPENPAGFFGRGDAWSGKKDYDKAIKDYDESMRLSVLVGAPKSAIEYFCRGYAWSCKKDYDKAIRDYDEAIRLDPKDVPAYRNRGLAWSKKNDEEKAIRDYDEAIRLDPKDAAAYRNRGVSWSCKMDFNKAIRDYDEAIRLNPNYAAAYRDRGQAWSMNNDEDKAMKDFDEAIRFDPKDALAYCGRGRAWWKQKYYNKAINDFDEAIRLEPEDAFFYYCRGNVWSSKKDYGKAQKDFDEAHRLDPIKFPAGSK